jgi:hypothetical protein
LGLYLLIINWCLYYTLFSYCLIFSSLFNCFNWYVFNIFFLNHLWNMFCYIFNCIVVSYLSFSWYIFNNFLCHIFSHFFCIRNVFNSWFTFDYISLWNNLSAWLNQLLSTIYLLLNWLLLLIKLGIRYQSSLLHWNRLSNKTWLNLWAGRNPTYWNSRSLLELLWGLLCLSSWW